MSQSSFVDHLFQLWRLLYFHHQQCHRRNSQPELYLSPESRIPLSTHQHQCYFLHHQQAEQWYPFQFSVSLRLNQKTILLQFFLYCKSNLHWTIHISLQSLWPSNFKKANITKWYLLLWKVWPPAKIVTVITMITLSSFFV